MPFSIAGVEDDFASAASSSNGSLWLGWTSYRSNGNIFFTSWNGTYNPSNPNAGWATPIQLTTDPHDSSNPSITVTSDGGAWLVFQTDRDSTSLNAFVDLYFKRSYDPMNLASWSTDARLTTDTYDNSQPSAVQVQAGTIGVAWKSNSPPAATYDIFYDTLTFQNLQVLSVNPTPSVTPGSTVSIGWTVANRGNNSQSVSLNLYWNTTHSINSTPVNQPSLSPGLNWTSNYSWNTIGLTSGVYNILVQISCGCLNEENLSDNSLSATTIIAVRDVGIQSIAIPQFIYRGQAINVNVTVVNEGQVPENFNLMVFYNSTIKTFGTSLVSSLRPGSTRTVSILWYTNATTVKPGGCLLSAYIPPLPTETHTSDNNFTAQYPYSSCVRKVGDVDTVADGAVDVTDLIQVWQHEFTNSAQYEVDGCPSQGPDPQKECFPDHFVDIDDLVQTYIHQFT